MAETLIPLSSFRWLRLPTDRDPFNPMIEPMGRLQQAFRKPGSDVLLWRDVPIVREQ